jgi:CheY-like chemotaxis protein
MEIHPGGHPLLGHTILLVEDNEDEIFMMQRAFRKAQIPNRLETVSNGEQALDYLHGRNQFADRSKFPLPTVIFLDLNMPKMGGLEVLEKVRQHSTLKKLIINILSASTRSADIERAALLGANAYFIKPAQIEKFQELIQGWYNLSRFEAYPQAQS